MYFKLDVSSYTFVIFKKRMVKVVRKMNNDKYFDTEGVLDSFDLNVSIEAIFILRMPYA
jgi:hypothetical protein